MAEIDGILNYFPNAQPEKPFTPNEREDLYYKIRFLTLYGTASSTDEIRRTIASGDYEHQSSLQVYYDIHRNHIIDNSFAYDQESHQPFGAHVTTPKDIGDQAGKRREGPASVGNFHNTPTDELESLESSFFGLIDTLRQRKDIIRALPLRQKLTLLALTDEIQTIAHFPENVSGRTNEDFLIFLAHEFDVTLTISPSGFRGQLGLSTVETRMETEARWQLRDSITSRIEELFFEGADITSHTNEGKWTHKHFAEAHETGNPSMLINGLLEIRFPDDSWYDLPFDRRQEEYEKARDILWNAAEKSRLQATNETIDVLEHIGRLQTTEEMMELLDERLTHSPILRSHVDVLEEATNQDYVFLPEEEQTQLHVVWAIVHMRYVLDSLDTNPSKPGFLGYQYYHVHQMIDLLHEAYSLSENSTEDRKKVQWTIDTIRTQLDNIPKYGSSNS